MRKLELVKRFRMEQENENVEMYRKAFPNARPTIFQLELIEESVDDPQAWKKAVIFWAGNNYRAESVFKMIEYYKQVKAGTVQTFRENPKPQVGAWDGRDVKPVLPCEICGKDICFSLHQEERRTA